MSRTIPLVNLEEDQKFDHNLMKRLVKIVEFLQNIEDWLQLQERWWNKNNLKIGILFASWFKLPEEHAFGSMSLKQENFLNAEMLLLLYHRINSF